MKCSIKLKSFNYLILNNISKLCLDNKNKFDLKKISIIPLKTKKKKFSLIKSPHVHKKSREQFEIIYYNRILFLEGSYKNIKDFINNFIIKSKRTFFYKISWQK